MCMQLDRESFPERPEGKGVKESVVSLRCAGKTGAGSFKRKGGKMERVSKEPNRVNYCNASCQTHDYPSSVIPEHRKECWASDKKKVGDSCGEVKAVLTSTLDLLAAWTTAEPY